jgi:succinoglycan exporter
MTTQPPSRPKRETSTGSLFTDASWRAGGYAVSMIAKFALTPILARLLTEDQFGVAAIGFSIVLFFFMIGYAGVPQALVIAKEDKAELWSTAFWLNLTIGLLFAASAFFGAPYLAEAVRTPTATPIIQAFALLIPLQLIQGIGWARLTRDRRHQRLAVADTAAEITGAVCAVVAAFSGWGVWSLVVQQFVSLAVRAPICLWRVGLNIRLHFSFADIRPYARFSLNILLTDLCAFFTQGLPTLILSRTFSTAVVGVYDMGRRLAALPRMILSSSIAVTLLPAFVQLRDDAAKFKRAVVRSIHLANTIQAPAYLGLAAIGDPIIRVMMGERWAAGGIIVTLVAADMALRSVVNGFESYFSSLQQSGKTLMISLVLAASAGVGASIGATFGDPAMVAAGILIADLIVVPVVYVLWMRHAGVRFGEGAVSALKPLFAAAAMAAIVWSGLYFSPWLVDMQPVRLVIAVAAGGLLYPLIMLAVDRITLFEILRLVGAKAPLPGRVKRMLARTGSSAA